MSANEHLAKIKMNLDLKYESWARLSSSKTKQRRFHNKSKEYRRQWLRLGGTEEQYQELKAARKSVSE